ncbi:MAG: Crp/Fnr family transcriptional regulator [Firmicutes bacterium]|nr:Crp/Fnr family transcriptional regulator [Bacillota bacterium]
MPECGHHEFCVNRVPLFASLDEADQAEIQKLVRKKEYPAGAVIVQEGEKGAGLFVLNSGQVKLYKSSTEGREQLVYLLFSGDFFGELTLLLDSPFELTAEALEETGVCFIESRDFRRLLLAKPALSLELSRQMARRLQKAESLVGGLGLQDARQRVVAFLRSQAAATGRPAGKGREVWVELPTSRKETAALLGITPETLSRRLHELEAEGKIVLKGWRGVAIRDPERLE